MSCSFGNNKFPCWIKDGENYDDLNSDYLYFVGYSSINKNNNFSERKLIKSARRHAATLYNLYILSVYKSKILPLGPTPKSMAFNKCLVKILYEKTVPYLHDCEIFFYPNSCYEQNIPKCSVYKRMRISKKIINNTAKILTSKNEDEDMEKCITFEAKAIEKDFHLFYNPFGN